MRAKPSRWETRRGSRWLEDGAPHAHPSYRWGCRQARQKAQKPRAEVTRKNTTRELKAKRQHFFSFLNVGFAPNPNLWGKHSKRNFQVSNLLKLGRRRRGVCVFLGALCVGVGHRERQRLSVGQRVCDTSLGDARALILLVASVRVFVCCRYNSNLPPRLRRRERRRLGR